MKNKLIEEIAQIIYRTQGGASNAEEFEMATGRRLRIWKTDQPWDTQSDIELCEWERDDYRWQAKAVLEYIYTIKDSL